MRYPMRVYGGRESHDEVEDGEEGEEEKGEGGRVSEFPNANAAWGMGDEASPLD